MHVDLRQLVVGSVITLSGWYANMILKSAMIYTAPFVRICGCRGIDQQLYFLTMKSHLKLSVIIA